MSVPPPAFPSQVAENPDHRPLPEGYITRYDDRYNAWYYVDTRAQPPRSSWQHPHGPPPVSPQQSTTYSPPPNPPPNRTYNNNNNNNSGNPSYPSQYGASQYNPASPYQSRYEGQSEQRFPGSQQYPPQGYGYSAQGWPPQGGWSQQSPALGYSQQQQPPQPQQQQQRHGFGRNGGTGTALLAGGAGLLAGSLLTEAFEHHEEEEREEAYDQGYDDGQDNNFGGDW